MWNPNQLVPFPFDHFHRVPCLKILSPGLKNLSRLEIVYKSRLDGAAYGVFVFVFPKIQCTATSEIHSRPPPPGRAREKKNGKALKWEKCPLKKIPDPRKREKTPKAAFGLKKKKTQNNTRHNKT